MVEVAGGYLVDSLFWSSVWLDWLVEEQLMVWSGNHRGYPMWGSQTLRVKKSTVLYSFEQSFVGL